MSVPLIQQRLDQYQCQSAIDEENTMKEITQEVILMALSRSDFFKFVEFHGGTALRILYGLQRFSEDLDFALVEKDLNFNWEKYFSLIYDELQLYGYKAELHDRSKTTSMVNKAFLKDNSLGKVLLLSYPNAHHHMKKICIKMEVDVNPPQGSESELKFLDFPLPYRVRSQTQASTFSGKIHALLCREYLKGRDWYDFNWYISRKTKVNYKLLTNSLTQNGPWQGKDLLLNKEWLIDALTKKIESINWKQAREDVQRFVKPAEWSALDLWSQDFFLSRLETFSG